MLKNKVAYITGGSKGIGLAVAKSLLKQGMKVAISGRNGKNLEAAMTTLNDPENSLAIVSNVINLQEEQAAIEQIISKWGKVDVVMANAGIGVFESIENLEPQAWHQMVSTNLTGVYNTLKASVGALKSSQGYYMTLASLAGANFFAKGAGYNATKFGVVGFTQAVMLDLRPHNVKVTTIMPGSVATHFNGNTPSNKDAWKIQPEDIGALVVDLLKMHPRTLPSKIEVRPTRPDLR